MTANPTIALPPHPDPPPRGGREKGVLAAGAGVLLLLALLLPPPAHADDPAPLRTILDSNPNFSGVWVDTVNNELIVGDDNHHGVFTYSRTATGAAAPLRTVTGLSTLLDYPSSVVVDNVNNELWAVNDDTSDRAVVFSRTANGDVAPLRVVDFKLFELAEKRTWGWSVDAVNNEVVGTFQNGSAIYVFDRGTGDLLRSISGAATGLADPHGVFIDTVNNEILVVNEGHLFGVAPQAPSITVFSRTASGNVAPLRTIQGASTGLSLPRPIHVDTVNNELAVANGDANSITVFSRTATGNVPPVRTIAGAATGLSNPTGVFIDSVNNEIVVANWNGHSVTVYPRTATGNVVPLRTITAGAGAITGLGNPGALAIDVTNNEFAVTNCVSHPRVAFFSRLADGQAGPLRVIEGQNTRISRSLHGVAIDPVNNEVLVPSTLEDAILVFNRAASGNVAPLRVIQGPATGVNKPQGIAVDTVNNEIALANELTPSITIYSRTTSGNVAPLRTITDALNLSKPVGVWIDNVNNEIVVGDGSSATGDFVLVYSRLANGPSTPLRRISGAATLLNKIRQLAVDTTNNEIIVASQGNRDVNPPVFGTVAVFDRLADGNVAPKRFLQHVTTSFVQHPRSVWVDAVNNEIGVGDSKRNEIRVFARLFGTPPVPGFSVSASPASQTVAPGAGTSYTVTVTPTGGFTGAVTLSATGLPAGATASFVPNPTSASSTMTVATATTTPTGTFPLTITGTSGALTRSTTVTLVVAAGPGPDFSLSASPASQVVVGGTSTTYVVTITPQAGFTGSVTLSVTGLPAATTASFAPNPTTGTSTLTVTAGAATPTGTFTLAITGVSGALTHSTTVSLIVDN